MPNQNRYGRNFGSSAFSAIAIIWNKNKIKKRKEKELKERLEKERI